MHLLMVHFWSIYAINFHFVRLHLHVIVMLMVCATTKIQSKQDGALLAHQCMLRALLISLNKYKFAVHFE